MTRRARTLLHGAAALAFVLAALDPAWGPPTRGGERWVLLDVSASAVRGRGDRYGDLPRLLRPALDSLRPGDGAGILAFAEGPRWIVPPADAQEVRGRLPRAFAEIADLPDESATNFEAALGEVLRLAAGEGDVVLASDGVETVGSARRLSRAIEERGLVVHRILLGPAGGEDASVESVSAPATVRPGTTVRARAVVRSSVEGAARARLHWRFTSEEGIAERETSLFLSGSRTSEESGEFEAPSRGSYRIEAKIVLPEGRDRAPENDAAGSGGRTEGVLRVAVLGDEAAAFENVPGASVVSLPAADAIEGALGECEVLVLLGVPLARDNPKADRIVSAVERGGMGLLLATTSEWNRTGPLGTVLPLRSRNPESGADVFVLLDASGSMEGRKFDSAREGVVRFAEGAGASDTLYGAAFAESKGEVVLLRAPGRAAPEPGVAAFLGSVLPRGNTDLFRAIREGAEFLDALPRGPQAAARRRLLFVLTDGRHESGPVDLPGAATALRAAGARLTLFAIGEDVDRGALDALAAAAGGTVLDVEDPSRLGDALRREGEGEEVRREREVPRRREGRRAASFPAEVPPTLARGRCLSKDGAEVLYEFEDGEPLLAVWNAGKGKAAAFASRPGTEDAPGWEDAKDLWSAIFERLAPEPRLEDSRIEGDLLVVEVRGDPGDSPGLLATVDGVAVSLERTGAHRFEGRLPSDVTTPAAVEILLHGGATRSAGVVDRPFPREFAAGPGQDVAGGLVSATGGTSVDIEGLLPPPPGGSERRGLRPYAVLAGAAIVLLLAALRRLKGSAGRADDEEGTGSRLSIGGGRRRSPQKEFEMRFHPLVFLVALLPLPGCGAIRRSPFVGPDPTLEAKIRQGIEDLRYARNQELIEIVRALANAGEPAFDLLIEALDDDSPSVRAACVLVLGSTGDRRLIPYLVEVEEDPDATVRYEVARALVRLGDWTGVPVLVAGMRDPSLVVRGLCHDALRDATRLDFGFVPSAATEDREQAIARWEEWWERRRNDPFFGRG